MKNPFALKSDDNLLELDPLYSTNSHPTTNEYYETTVSSNGEDQQLRQILIVLKRNWLMILSINFVVTALVIIWVAQKAEYFEASARVQVNAETNPATGKSGSSVIVTNSGSDPAYFTTQLQIIEGAGLLRRVVKALDLEHNQAFLNPRKGKELTVWQNVLRLFNLYKSPETEAGFDDNSLLTINSLNLKTQSQKDLDAAAEKLAPFVSRLKKNLKVEPVKDNRTTNKETRLIEIQFTHNDRFVAAKIANAIADTYVLMNLEQKIESNETSGDFLQQRVSELQSQIRTGEERLINYSRNNQIISLDGSQNTVVQKLADANIKLSQAENDRIETEIAYRNALRNPAANLIAESKDPQTVQLESGLTGLRQRLAQLKEEYTDEWPDVVNLRGEIAKAETELETARQRASNVQLRTLEHAFREARARETELGKIFEGQRNEVLNQNEAAINYRIIQQEIETNKKLYDGLLQRLRENDVVLNGTPNNVAVIDRALTPHSPLGSETTKDILIAFLGSLGFGVGLALLRNWLNDTVKSSDNLEKQTNLTLLATIPLTNSGIADRLLGFKLNRNKFNGKTTDYRASLIAESYIRLRTYLLLAHAGTTPRTILVTSAESGEGKTTTALNLALSLAELSEKVLLIDADLRLPQIHSLLNLSNHSGISNLLTGKIAESAIESTVRKLADSNLQVITAGPAEASPANLFGSDSMSEFLNYLNQKYSFIVIDSPPVLYFADSVVLSTAVDAVVLVIRENYSSRMTIQRTKKVLQQVGARIAGVVLNAAIVESPNRYQRHQVHSQKKKQQFRKGLTR